MDEIGPERMLAGAKILTGTCAGVRAGEQVLVLTDRDQIAIGGALASAAGESEGRVTLAIPPARTIDNESPPAAVAAAMRASDVVFLVTGYSLTHTRATREAVAEGARVCSMTAFTPRQMMAGGLFTDFRARRPICDRRATPHAGGTCPRPESGGHASHLGSAGPDRQQSLLHPRRTGVYRGAEH